MNNTFINALIKDNMLQLNKKGFTLIELLVVIAIIGVLGSIVFAPFNEARKKGRDGKRMAELKAIQSSLILYSEDNSSCYPNGVTTNTSATSTVIRSDIAGGRNLNQFITPPMAAKIIQMNGAAALGGTLWTTNQPYAYRSVGDATSCSNTNTIIVAAATTFYPNYQLFTELETHTSGLDGDADANIAANGAGGNFVPLDLSGVNLEVCVTSTVGNWDCIYDLSNL